MSHACVVAIETVLIIPDTHRPFHHVKAYNLMLSVASDLKIDEIVILGDYADFYSVSSHPKDPRLAHNLMDEVEDVNLGLDELDRLFPLAKKVFIEGNHEHRLQRFIFDRCPALFGVTEVRNLFGFEKRPKWKFIPYGPNQLYKVANSFLFARHEPSGSSAKVAAAKALCSIVYGHIHRIEESHIVGLEGINHVAFSCGWLGDKRKDEVFGYVKNHHQWQLGFTIAWVDTETRLFYHQKVHILESGKKISCCVNGKIYSD